MDSSDRAHASRQHPGSRAHDPKEGAKDENGSGRNRPGGGRLRGRKKRLLMGFTVCVLLLAGGAALMLKKSKEPKRVVPEVTAIRVGMPEPMMVPFEAFIIPFHREGLFTVITLKISLCTWRAEVKNTLRAKKALVRASIYDLLAREFAHSLGVPPLDAVKTLILKGANAALPQGGVEEVFVTEFLPI